MFMAQELTVRLGLCTGKGYAELIRQRYGQPIAMAATAVLLLSCFGALITEMSAWSARAACSASPPGRRSRCW